jgi:hypothetical protein
MPGRLTTRVLSLGESSTIEVKASDYWSDTGLELANGALYECRADGRWLDWHITSGPDGYDASWWPLLQPLFNRWRRIPTARWFALCGAVQGKETDLFLIGSRAQLRLPAGRLLCFANDLSGFYWNNSGAVTLTLERIA